MGQPKKQSSMRKTGTRRSHLLLNLARRVNGKSPIKIHTTNRETGKKTKITKIEVITPVKTAKKSKKPATSAK
jgi:hypothetical protein